MRHATPLWFAIGIASLCVSAPAQEEPQLTLERESIWRSRYVWRGIVLEPMSTHEASTTLGFGNAWLNIWTYGRDPETHLHRGHREVDFTFGADFESAGWSLSPSFILYTYPSGWEPRGTLEFALEASCEFGGGFALLANAFLDLAADRGASFLELGIGYQRELGEGITLDASILTGRGDRKFNASNHEVAKAAWNAVYGEVGLGKDLGRGFSLRFAAGQSRTLDRRLREASDRPHNSHWTLSLGYSK